VTYTVRLSLSGPFRGAEVSLGKVELRDKDNSLL
jgi:hypothetical protein